MQGHVMPSFPHTLIGLGPFANLGCQIVFTKTAVSVTHPDGHIILEGWREQDGPRLWRFPLNATKASLPVPALYEKYEEPGPRGSAANFFSPPLANLIEQPSESIMPSLASQSNSIDQIHPSQGIIAIDTAGQACSVTYMYGAAQAIALASLSSKTSFDPRSLDLPSMAALVGFYH
jgi:hypothetical protein